ncbi:MAG: maleylacetate reductase [Nocardioides sp.]
MNLTHDWPAQRVRFATGAAAEAVSDEVRRLGAARVLAIASDRDRAEPVLSGVPVAHWQTDVVMHVPVENAERARASATEHDADALVCVGGGSTTGLAKAIAITTGLPIVAVPTTYAGSEATDVWGLTEHGAKTTGTDLRALPRCVVYDASLTLGLPVPASAASGMNAVAHCVDAMWGPRVDPIDQALALEGIRTLREGLPRVVAEPTELAGREQALLGAYLAAVAFASAGSGLHHKICHVLGGLFGLPHAETHAAVLPHVLALNAPAVPDIDRRLASAFGSDTALSGLLDLRDSLGVPRALRDLGLSADDLPRAVAPILDAAPSDNPVPVTGDVVTALLEAAWEGKEPT